MGIEGTAGVGRWMRATVPRAVLRGLLAAGLGGGEPRGADPPPARFPTAAGGGRGLSVWQPL